MGIDIVKKCHTVKYADGTYLIIPPTNVESWAAEIAVVGKFACET